MITKDKLASGSFGFGVGVLVPQLLLLPMHAFDSFGWRMTLCGIAVGLLCIVASFLIGDPLKCWGRS